jgi:DNA-directed RNA polymerase specialized sigma24 family protein
MEHDEALDELPESYAQALRLRRVGLPDAAIAIRLAIPTESAHSLLQLAEAKLANVLDARAAPVADGPT